MLACFERLSNHCWSVFQLFPNLFQIVCKSFSHKFFIVTCQFRSIQISNLENIKTDLPNNNLDTDILRLMTIDNLAKVPGEDLEFTMNTGWIEKTQTGTFEVTYINKETGKVLTIGDLQTGSTDGNWE